MDTAVPDSRPTRGELLRWAGWFGMANGALAALIGLRYFLHYSFPADGLGLVYTVFAFVGHFASLGLLVVLPAMLVIAIWPQRTLAYAVAVLPAVLLLTLLVTDSNIFADYRYHLTPLIAAIFSPGTWFFVGVIALVALAFELMLAGATRRWVARASGRYGAALGIALIAVWLAGQGIHIWADAVGYRAVTQVTRYLPGYFPIHAKRRMASLGLVDPAVVERQRLLQKAGGDGDGQLHYPLQPMQCAEGDSPPLNIVMVLVDGLRPDVADPGLLPNVAALRRDGLDFTRHFSGGNSSRAGIFSAFYGLPSTYMETFYAVQRPPVLLDVLRARGYETGLFSAPGFSSPMGINRTVFAGIEGLAGERSEIGPVERNLAVTRDWIEWLDRRNGDAPFFGFLYYDPPMAAMSAAADANLALNGRFAEDEAIQAQWRQYRRAMALIDVEIGRLRSDLAARGLADRTLFILWSDHGYEFDDSGTGRVGHASGYGPAQLRATLAMAWPGQPPARYTHRTSHHDLPVTLLEGVFGCANPPSDYSTGRNLFDGDDWDWIIAGSYNSHAIIEPDRIVISHPGGFVETLDRDYQPTNAGLDARIIQDALAEMRRFYR